MRAVPYSVTSALCRLQNEQAAATDPFHWRCARWHAQLEDNLWPACASAAILTVCLLAAAARRALTRPRYTHMRCRLAAWTGLVLSTVLVLLGMLDTGALVSSHSNTWTPV